MINNNDQRDYKCLIIVRLNVQKKNSCLFSRENKTCRTLCILISVIHQTNDLRYEMGKTHEQI